VNHGMNKPRLRYKIQFLFFWNRPRGPVVDDEGRQADQGASIWAGVTALPTAGERGSDASPS